MTATTHLSLPLIAAGQAQKHVTHNEALLALDALVHCAVKEKGVAAPPGTPAEGDRYIVAAAPTGAWTGKAGQVAAWQDGAWRFYAPQAGWIAFVVDELQLYHFDGSAWAPGVLAITSLQNLTFLGVGTTADATNPFSTKLNNVLHAAKMVAEGGTGDLRVKLSKETAAKTASYLFQTNFSARAEFGLAGDDDFHLKVSPDGAAWTEALLVDRATGTVSLPAGATSVTPAAGTNSTAVATTAFVDAGAIREAGQCRLAKSGSNLVLSRRNGHRIVIGGVVQTIPSAGVSLAAAGLTPDTTYFIYASMNAGAMTLEASTTGHATDATTGVEIKAGDASRTLVGMARPIAGPAWQDTAKQRFVRSWFNRRREILTNGFTADRSTSSATDVELNAEIRLEFLAWPDDTLMTNHSGTIYSNTVPTTAITRHKLDGAATLPLNAYTQMDVAFAGYYSSGDSVSAISAEGYHYVGLMGASVGGATCNWQWATFHFRGVLL
ncbi:MAG: hypothetical protein K0S06_837 [Microvirga sp.]|nr:hypothetical protein [Microvirga sp.]